MNWSALIRQPLLNLWRVWDQSLLGVCMVVRTHANACYRFFYLHVAFMRLHELAWHSNGSIKWQTSECHFKRVNTSNLMTFECCFLISRYHEICNPMSSFTVLRHVPLEHFYLPCSSMFSLVCYCFFIVYYLFLVMHHIANTACWNCSRTFNFRTQYSKKRFKIITIKKILLS